MTDEQFADLLALAHERRGVEFKGPCAASDPPIFQRIVRAALGMANLRDGGVIVVGVEENGDAGLRAVGLTEEQLSTWSMDDVAPAMASYADPFVSFELEIRTHDGKRFVVLFVDEFEEIPVICRKDYRERDGGAWILRKGACYIRTRTKPETSEIPSQTEMRDLLSLAIDKGVRAFVTRATAAGLNLPGVPETRSDADRYRDQIGDL